MYYVYICVSVVCMCVCVYVGIAHRTRHEPSGGAPRGCELHPIHHRSPFVPLAPATRLSHRIVRMGESKFVTAYIYIYI